MKRTRCIVLDVDGIPVRARVSGKLTERDLEALREIARAARKQLEASDVRTAPKDCDDGNNQQQD